MISAKEARLLSQTSRTAILRHLDNIGLEIERVAKLDNSEIILDRSFPYTHEYKVEKKDYRLAELTEFQLLLKKELESPELQYSVTMIEEKHDGKGGLGCMDDDPKPFSTYHIRIRW